MIPEPFNTLIVVIICISAVLYFNGYLSASNRSVSVTWLKSKNPIYLRFLTVLFIFAASLKVLMLVL
ncbi:hypothetical protein ALT761_02397 [Alteromonas sp. 76-1]|nr:hypothetical protein ALT761_02397 [Alteromonas sp. 76-1]